LTGARFVAAVVVVAYHLVRFDRWPLPDAVARLAALGPAAVTFFFVLSGFVLTRARSDDDDDHRRDRSAGRRFLAARLARLLPMHALALVVVLPIVIGLWRRTHGDGGNFVDDVLGPGVLVAFAVQSWWPSTALAWNPPAWSLSVEVAFYVAFPWIVPRLVALPVRRCVAVVVGFLGAAFLPGVLLLAMARDRFDVGPTVHNFVVDAWRYHPLARAPEFLVGVALAQAMRAGWTPSAAARAAASVVVLIVVGSVGAGILPAILVHNGLLAPAFAVAIATLTAPAGVLPTGVARMLSTPLALLLGEASYALYLLHVPVLFWIAAFGQRRDPAARVLDEPVVALVAGLVCIVVAVLVHVVIERPARRGLRGALVPLSSDG
jgi:peptidoglycan/LPS O-acetylase OafA/YrhL